MNSLIQRLKNGFSLVLSFGPESEPAWLSLREQLLQLVVLGSAVLGAVVLLPSAILTITEGQWGMSALDFLVYEWILSLLLFRNYLSYKTRAYSLCLLVYILGLAIFIKLGPLRAGMIYLFLFQVMATVLLGLRAAVYAGIMNAIAMAAVGVLLGTGYMEWSVPQDQPVFRWGVLAVNFIFINTVVTTMIVAVTNGMTRALHKERIAADSMHEKARAQMIASQALEASEERFALAIKGSREGLWDWNLQEHTFLFSPAWKTMLGYEEEEIGHTLDEFTGRLHPEDKDRVSKVLDSMRSKEGGDSFELECRMRRKDGTYHTFLVRGYGQRDSQGNTLRILGAHTDLTRLSRSETALRESEEKYMTLVEQSVQGLAIFGVNPPSLLYSNRSLSMILGYSPHELKATGLDQMKKWVHPGDWPSVAKCVDRYLEKKPVPPLLEYRLTDRDGNLVWIEASGAFIRYQNQDAVLMTCLDITKRKYAEQEKANLEEQLRQVRKNQALGALAGGIAHDFGRYLTPILGYAEMATQSLEPDHPAREDIVRIMRLGREASDLASQINEFGKLPKQRNQPVNVALVASGAIRRIQEYLPPNVRLTKRISDQCTPVQGDSPRIRQLINILCSRALNSMAPTGGELTITLEEKSVSQADLLPDSILGPGKHLCLTVSDSGPGAGKDIAPKIYNSLIFKDIYGQEGGVSLVLAQSIVKRHNGDFQISSKSGKGLIYTVILPADGALPETAHVVDIRDLPPGNEWILLVDDEKPILDMTRQTLERLGYQVTALASGKEAWKKFQENPGKYDMVITDYNMPEMTGDKLVKQLFSLRPQIPVIMCTGFSEKFSESLARELGIMEYVTKPVLMQEFAYTIRKVLDGGPQEYRPIAGQTLGPGGGMPGKLPKAHNIFKI
ncbi:MAG: PAS domain-containing protein [Desulfatibacillum sp.]|nr:PAS domain-containing protein [Desulfatibacillum sp.]